MTFLHFENNEKLEDRTSPDYKKLWKIRRVVSYLNNKYSILYHPTENLAVDEITEIGGKIGV
jgi:hypothetical protein